MMRAASPKMEKRLRLQIMDRCSLSAFAVFAAVAGLAIFLLMLGLDSTLLELRVGKDTPVQQSAAATPKPLDVVLENIRCCIWLEARFAPNARDHSWSRNGNEKSGIKFAYVIDHHAASCCLLLLSLAGNCECNADPYHIIITIGPKRYSFIMQAESLVPIKDEPAPARLLKRGSSHGSSANLGIEGHGEEGTLEYRIKAHEKEGVAKGKKEISLWHDVTLVHIDPATDRPTPYLNFVCEIPKFSR